MITKKDTIVKIRSNNLDGKGVLNICSQSPINTVELFISAPDGKEFAFVYPASGNCFVGTFALENASLWSVNEPNLYKYCVEINGGEESVFGSFGFRELSTNGKEICLNGTPLFVRGYIRGTTAHDHQNNAKLTLDEFYRKNISAAKKFGFNLVRFHSVVPDEAFLRAADELGLLVHIELRPPHDLYNNLEEMVTSGSDIVPIDFLKDVINRLYEHPSLAVYCIGNEIKNLTRGGEEVAKIKHLVDTLDGTRLFLDTCAWGENNRPNIDIDVQHMSYYFPFGKNEKMYEDTVNLLVVSTASNKPLKTESDGVALTRTLSFRVPLIAHEVCHYTALRDFKGLKEKFLLSGSSLPWWVDEELKMIEAKGYTERYGEMYKASKNFQKECWKTAYEAMRTSWLLGGFHFLQFADTDVY